VDEVPERLEAIPGLLDRYDVEPGDDLGYAQQRMQVALGRISIRGLPLLGEVSEGAYVPGGDQQVAVECPGRHASVLIVVERRAQRGKVGRYLIGGRVDYLGHLVHLLHAGLPPLAAESDALPAAPFAAGVRYSFSMLLPV
jgi:hypothetical protein